MKVKSFKIIIDKEKLSNHRDIFVAHCSSLGIASQGYIADQLSFSEF